MTAKHNKIKKPKSNISPQNEKSVRKRENPEDFDKMLPVWTVGHIDRCELGGWANISESEFWNDIYSKLKNFESMTWAEIKCSGSHNVKKNDLISEAKKRLDQLRLDDLDEVFSLRLTGTKRIFGMLNKGILGILWYDPNHLICPAPKKNS